MDGWMASWMDSEAGNLPDDTLFINFFINFSIQIIVSTFYSLNIGVGMKTIRNLWNLKGTDFKI